MIKEIEDIKINKSEAKDIVNTMLQLVKASENSSVSDDAVESAFIKMANYVKDKMHDERDISTIVDEIKDIFVVVLTKRLKS